MSEMFSIGEWLGPGTERLAERITHAEIGINIGENCVTLVEDLESRTVRSTIRASAEPMARWLVANWWRLRWEPEPVSPTENLDWLMAHSVAAIGSGYVWPDLVFTGSDGARISVVCKRSTSVSVAGPVPVRFLNAFASTVPANDFESSVDTFVEQVLSRLISMGVKKSELQDLWNDLSRERNSPRLSAYRRLEAYLGLDPDADDPLIASLIKWSRQLGQHAVEEIAAASKIAEIQSILLQLKNVAQTIKTFAEVPKIDELYPVTSGFVEKLETAPWQQGQSLAYALRDKWDLGDAPLDDDILADRLSLPAAKLKETQPDTPFSFGYRGARDGKLGFALNRANDHGRRFDLARLLGEYLSPDFADRMIPVTNTMTKRQKFQRAFAAEFLCPSVMIQERYPDGIEQRSIGKVIGEISEEYNVSERVVLHHMENRRLLSPGLIDSPLLLA